jgi:tryptophan 2,3-dioxygenase
MKRTTPSKNKKKSKGRETQNPEVHVEAVRVLRTVGDHEAFYFYEAVGKPTGEVARNLSDFLDRVKSVKSESLMFHLQRKDFQNWVQKILGDSKLAEELKRISPSDGDDIRAKIHETVENRVRELRESSAEISVDESAVVLLPYP